MAEKGIANPEEIKVNEAPTIENSKAPVEQIQAVVEHKLERADASLDQGVSNMEQKSSGMTSRLPQQQSLKSVEQEKEIEDIMSRGLAEIYLDLGPEEQEKFRKAGEESAKKINELLSEGKIQIAKIFNLIKNWLAMLPGVNKYFVEQEAKIKVDEIIQLKKGGEQ
jgi:hypothetical protein